MFAFAELTMTSRQTIFIRNLNGVFVLCTTLDESKISESLSLTFHRLADLLNDIWTASSEFGAYRLCEQRRFRRACASAQSRQNLRCSLIQAVSQEEPSDRKPDPWPLWMAGHAQLKFVMTECSKTKIRLTGLILSVLSQIICCFTDFLDLLREPNGTLEHEP